MPRNKVRSRRGGAMVEMVLFCPWIFFLFIGALDWGFYASALISLQAGVRSAALYTSTDLTTAADTVTPCRIVLDEMRKLPNVGPTASCPSANPSVSSTLLSTGPGGVKASRVSVTYTSITLIPIPGALAKQFTITRAAVMPLRSTT